MQSPVAVVSLSAIVRNARLLKRRAGAALIAVVKNDGYGHGAAAVAHALSGEAAMFAVATVDEGAALRCAGILSDILVLTPPSCMEEGLRAEAYGLILAAGSMRSLAFCRGRVHLAVNTGMNRYGFAPQETGRACAEARSRGLRVEGVFSHYYAAADACARGAQNAVFEGCAARVRQHFPRAVRHIAATGGIAAGGTLYDAVRPGLALYGYGAEGVLPAMKVYAEVLHGTERVGGGAGYARAPRGAARLYTLGVGYGDGFFRGEGLCGAGPLCMDACVRQGDAAVGERVCVLENAAAYAEKCGTTAYEALVGIGKGMRKVYER